MTVGTMRSGRPIPLSSYEFQQWRARDRALLKLDQHAQQRRQVLAAVRGTKRGR